MNDNDAFGPIDQTQAEDFLVLTNPEDGSIYAGRTFVFSLTEDATFVVVDYSWTHKGNVKENPAGAMTCTLRLESLDLEQAKTTGLMVDSRIKAAASPTVVAKLSQWIAQRSQPSLF